MKCNGYSDFCGKRCPECSRFMDDCDGMVGYCMTCDKREISDLKAKLAEYERQIKEGELIPLDVAKSWVRETFTQYCSEMIENVIKTGTNTCGLKVYAASNQKEGGE